MDHRERACYLGASVNAIRKSWRWWEEKDLGEAPAPASSSEVQVRLQAMCAITFRM